MFEIVVISPTVRSDLLLERACLSVKKNASADIQITHFVIYDNTDISAINITNDDYYKLVLLRNHGESGASATRNYGIRNITAQFKYFIFLDSDDYLADDYIVNTIIKLEDSDATIAFGQGMLCGEVSKRLKYSNVPINEGLVNRKLVIINIIGCPSGITIRNTTKNRNIFFDTKLKYLEDHMYYIALLHAGNVFVKTNEKYFYTIHDKQSTNPKNLLDVKRCFALLRERANHLYLSRSDLLLLNQRVKVSENRLLQRNRFSAIFAILIIGVSCPLWVLGRIKMWLGWN